MTQWACLQGHAAAAEDRQRIEGLIHEKAFLEGRLKEIVGSQQGSAADLGLVKVCYPAELAVVREHCRRSTTTWLQQELKSAASAQAVSSVTC